MFNFNFHLFLNKQNFIRKEQAKLHFFYSCQYLYTDVCREIHVYVSNIIEAAYNQFYFYTSHTKSHLPTLFSMCLWHVFHMRMCDWLLPVSSSFFFSFQIYFFILLFYSFYCQMESVCELRKEKR